MVFPEMPSRASLANGSSLTENGMVRSFSPRGIWQYYHSNHRFHAQSRQSGGRVAASRSLVGALQPRVPPTNLKRPWWLGPAAGGSRREGKTSKAGKGRATVRVVCTGMSGTGRTSYVHAVAQLARQRGRRVHVFDVRDTMFHLARERGEQLEEETILDVFPTALGAYRAAALERILAEVKALPPGETWILVTHATFSWNYSIVPGLDVYYLNLLEPDIYVTITDGILSIRQRLTEERWRRVTISTLLWWRDVERAAT